MGSNGQNMEPQQAPTKSGERTFSGVFNLLVAILTVLSVLCAGVYWIVHENDMREEAQVLNTQAIKNNTDAIKQLEQKIQQGDQNFDRMLKLMGRLHHMQE